MKEWLDKLRIAISEKRYAYQKTFAGPLAEIVLKDLALFCRAHESTYHQDARAHAMAEGRREVWLHLQHHLRLTPNQLWEVYTRRPANEE